MEGPPMNVYDERREDAVPGVPMLLREMSGQHR